MPFFYDEAEIEGLEDSPDLSSPRADQFVYKTPLSYAGVREPVHIPRAPIAPRPPSHEQAEGVGILARLFGRASPASPPQPSQGTDEEKRRRFFAVMVKEFREAGLRRVYCRYDGGNDEGFSWLDSVETEDGRRIDANDLSRKLDYAQIERALAAADAKQPGISGLEYLCDWLSNDWASLLLSDGFGVGEHLIYGAFTVDLEACTITDDPKADPIVQHIEIAK